MGDDEIKLVRKKLKWPYPPFEIPENILKEWRKIGQQGEVLEKNWIDTLNKSKPEIKEKFNILNNKLYNKDLGDINLFRKN